MSDLLVGLGVLAAERGALLMGEVAVGVPGAFDCGLLQKLPQGVLVGGGEIGVHSEGYLHGITGIADILEGGLAAGWSKGTFEDLAKIAQNGIGLRELRSVVRSDADGGVSKGVREGLNMVLPIKGLLGQGC